MAYEDYVKQCVERQTQKESVLKDAQPVELTEEEKKKLATYLRYQAASARQAFNSGKVPALDSLAYELARGVHDGWTAGKARDGWTYAEKRNDEKKKHHLMKPCGELSFEEFRWDVDTAISAMLDMAQGLDPR